ncbi:MAG: hypothetical protein ACRDF6_07775, partial [bacterium]
IDPTDQDALDAWMEDFNARPRSERDRVMGPAADRMLAGAAPRSGGRGAPKRGKRKAAKAARRRNRR